MKNNTILLFFVLLMVNSCGKEETNLEVFNPEAFAYDLGDSWEVNAMINVKGFEQRESSGDTFEASISYSADIKTPDEKTIKNIYPEKIKTSARKELVDIPLEIQFELDSTYSLGKYTIIFNITDIYSQNTITGSAEFDLTE
jgi:hypothetical protein